MKGYVITGIVAFGWICFTALFIDMARRSLRTGQAPFQSFNISAGIAPITRTSAPSSYWMLVLPVVLFSGVGVIGSIVLILALFGAFGPLAS